MLNFQNLFHQQYSNGNPSHILPGSQFTWSDNQFTSQENYGSQTFNGRLGFTETPRIEENLTPDEPEDRIFKGWELKPHEFPWMVKLKVRTKSIDPIQKILSCYKSILEFCNLQVTKFHEYNKLF